jgi:endonuclease-3
MTKKQRALAAVQALKTEYPGALCSLNAQDPLQLLVATILSAQCTDARVNLVTPALFAHYPAVADFAAAEVTDVEHHIHSCGFYHAKALHITEMAKMLLSNFDSKVPGTIEELTQLPGVGRKTANLIVGDIFGKPAVVVDTHLIRLSNLLGIVDTKDPYKIEMQLKELLPQEESNDFCHRCVLHGRAVCVARRPKCNICCMNQFCVGAQNI